MRLSSASVFSQQIYIFNSFQKLHYFKNQCISTLPKVNASFCKNDKAVNCNSLLQINTKCKNECNRKLTVLGIETSCDDTGAAVVDENANIIGEALHSQQELHVKLGGILPPIARSEHIKNIKNVVNLALERSGLQVQDVDAIATTVKPGLPLSLKVGLDYGKGLSRNFSRPFIPIHHMEAHALTARMIKEIKFPFLVLLASGGHCLLAIAQNVNKFYLLGQSLDASPGHILDVIARTMGLHHILEYEKLSGGQAIECLAEKGNINAFQYPIILTHIRDCNFSFSGLRAITEGIIRQEKDKYEVLWPHSLPNIADICASFQHNVFFHILHKLVRGFMFCEMNDIFSDKEKVLVLSGGVARNLYFRNCLEQVCINYDYQLFCPPPKLCSDNGVMIAWNGMEKLKLGIGVIEDLDSVDIQPKCPLGEDWVKRVTRCSIRVPIASLNFLKK